MQNLGFCTFQLSLLGSIGRVRPFHIHPPSFLLFISQLLRNQPSLTIKSSLYENPFSLKLVIKIRPLSLFLIANNASIAYNPRIMHLIVKKGLNAAKKNLIPGLLLQGFAFAIVWLYYFNPATQQFLLKIPELKEKLGLLFPLLVTALCGGLLPFIFLLIRKEIPPGKKTANLLFLLGFWAINGLYVDYLYQFQTLLFGDQPGIITIVKKVFFDQFVASVLISAPFAVIAIKWKQGNFSLRTTKAQLPFRKLCFAELPPVLISLWAVWIPTVAIVYSLPLALQFPLFNIVLCFWSLLLTALTHNNTPQGSTAGVNPESATPAIINLDF